MKTNITDIGKGQIRVSIELDAGELKRYLDQAETDLASKIEIDGFRKGKATKEAVRQKLGPQAILQEALESAVERSFALAVTENNLDVVSTANLSIKENTPEKLLYTVDVVPYPQVSLGDLGKVKIKRREVVVTEEEINKALDSVRSSRAQLEAKKDPVEEGDRVELDFEVLKDGVIIEGGQSKNHPLVIGKNTFIPGFEENLIGMTEGQEKEFKLKVPKDYFHKDIAGKEVVCKVKINTVHKVILPEVNDDFVKSVGKFTGVEHLRQSIREGILMEKTGQETERVRLEAINNLISSARIDIPEVLIDRQLDNMLEEFDHSLHSKGLELGFYLAHIGKTQDQLRSDWRGDAERQVRSSLVVRQIAKDKNISVSDKEIEDTTNEVIQNLVSRGQNSVSDIDVQRLKENIAQKLINERALEFIEGVCVE